MKWTKMMTCREWSDGRGRENCAGCQIDVVSMLY